MPESLDFVKAIKSVECLHANMAVLSRLNEILRDYNSNLADAEKLILSDGVLASTVIKISNSVLYGRGQTHTNVYAAIQQVGFSQVLKLVGMALSRQVFMKDLRAYGITADQYWFSSYFTALFMELQAKNFNLGSNDAYLIGLLHAIGKVVINELLHEHEVEIFWDPNIPSESWEKIMVGFTYSKAGGLLLKNWDFPVRIHESIGQQTSTEAQRTQPILSLLDFTRSIVERNSLEQALDAWLINTHHPFVEKHALSTETLLKDIDKVIGTIRQVRTTLKSL